MTRRERWKKVLAQELASWEARSLQTLLHDLDDEPVVYVVLDEGLEYQVEVDILENTEEYLHVGVSVDDGVLPWAIFPATTSLIVRKSQDAGDLRPPA